MAATKSKPKAPPKAVAKAGRPSTYTEALGVTVCARLAAGESMRAVCAGADMPDRRTVERWAASDADFAASIARAREAQADALAEEVVSIADDAEVTQYGLEHAKLRIASRQWFAAKVRPKVYGEPERGPSVAVQVNNNGVSLRDSL